LVNILVCIGLFFVLIVLFRQARGTGMGVCLAAVDVLHEFFQTVRTSDLALRLSEASESIFVQLSTRCAAPSHILRMVLIVLAGPQWSHVVAAAQSFKSGSVNQPQSNGPMELQAVFATVGLCHA